MFLLLHLRGQSNYIVYRQYNFEATAFKNIKLKRSCNTINWKILNQLLKIKNGKGHLYSPIINYISLKDRLRLLQLQRLTNARRNFCKISDERNKMR